MPTLSAPGHDAAKLPPGASRLPTFFIPHGGGPCFFMDWNPPGAWDAMAGVLRCSPIRAVTAPITVDASSERRAIESRDACSASSSRKS